MRSRVKTTALHLLLCEALVDHVVFAPYQATRITTPPFSFILIFPSYFNCFLFVCPDEMKVKERGSQNGEVNDDNNIYVIFSISSRLAAIQNITDCDQTN